MEAEKGFLDIQPEWCRKPLVFKEIDLSDRMTKVMFYDPTEIYDLIHEDLDPFARRQKITMGLLFPNEKGICACGCGGKLTGRQRRWRSIEHSSYCVGIYNIINGDNSVIYAYLSYYYGENCVNCKKKPIDVGYQLYVDHIFPVKHGGGAGWLSNYQLLCNKCHRTKTNKDFNWKGLSHNQLELIN